MEMKHSTHIRLLLGTIFASSYALHRNASTTRSAPVKLNNVRNIFSLLLIIEVGHILSGYILVLRRVVIGTVAMPHSSHPSNGKRCSMSVVPAPVEAKLFRIMVAQAQTSSFIPRDCVVKTEASPVLEPLQDPSPERRRTPAPSVQTHVYGR